MKQRTRLSSTSGVKARKQDLRICRSRVKQMKGRLLVFNCHEAWVYQLAGLDYNLDIAVGLPGHHTRSWDHHARPLPPRARTLPYQQALASSQFYSCIICHNPRDLLDIKHRPEPRILVLHLPVEARLVEEKSRMTAEQAKSMLHHYVKMTGTHVVSVSLLKGQSWDFTDDIIPFGLDPAEYLPYSGHRAAGLRISNFINHRRTFLHWDFHEQAFAGLPVTLVGHNPDIPEAHPSDNWDHLKKLLQAHRFYIHTADTVLEDGYNMATIEAMCAGLPILGNCHPSSVIEHGVNGFVSDDPRELRDYAQQLLDDRELAVSLGRAAQQTARERFSPAAFKTSFEKAIQIARQKRQGAADPVAPLATMPLPRPIAQPMVQELTTRQYRRIRPHQEIDSL